MFRRRKKRVTLLSASNGRLSEIPTSGYFSFSQSMGDLSHSQVKFTPTKAMAKSNKGSSLSVCFVFSCLCGASKVRVLYTVCLHCVLCPTPYPPQPLSLSMAVKSVVCKSALGRLPCTLETVARSLKFS